MYNNFSKIVNELSLKSENKEKVENKIINIRISLIINSFLYYFYPKKNFFKHKIQLIKEKNKGIESLPQT